MPLVSLSEVQAAASAWGSAPEASLAQLGELLERAGDEFESALPVLEHLILLKERYERIKRGQLPYHIRSLDELFFHHARAELGEYLRLTERAVSAPHVSLPSVTHRCLALFAAQHWGAVDNLLDHIVPSLGRHIWANVNFKAEFYQALKRMPDSDFAAAFPAVEYGPVPDQHGPVLYFACDFKYYLHSARAMLRSLAAHRPGTPVHLHLMDTSTTQRAEAEAFARDLGLAVSTSSEELRPEDRADIMAARGYFHAVRFVRLYQRLQLYPRELWLVDVDALINRDPVELFRMRADADIAIRARPGRFEPWNQFSAAVVGVAPVEKTAGYLRLIAAYITHFYKKGLLGWGIDQLAMFAVFQWLGLSGRQPSVALLDDIAAADDYRPESIIWYNAGRAKLFGESVDPNSPRARFDQAFQRYSSGL